jgi:large subunit ribosomal protein L35
MSKLKTRQSANKRYRRTRNGKIMYKRPYKAHILEKKSHKQKRHMCTIGIACRSDTKIIKTIMPF